MLELRIQDIITGTKDSDQDTAITEVVRVAKIQGKEKMRKLVENGVAIVMLCYLLIKGGLAFRGNTIDSMTYAELAVVLILLTAKCIMDHRTKAVGSDRFGKWMIAISIISGEYMIAGLIINTMMTSPGTDAFSYAAIFSRMVSGGEAACCVRDQPGYSGGGFCAKEQMRGAAGSHGNLSGSFQHLFDLCV